MSKVINDTVSTSFWGCEQIARKCSFSNVCYRIRNINRLQSGAAHKGSFADNLGSFFNPVFG